MVRVRRPLSETRSNLLQSTRRSVSRSRTLTGGHTHSVKPKTPTTLVQTLVPQIFFSCGRLPSTFFVLTHCSLRLDRTSGLFLSQLGVSTGVHPETRDLLDGDLRPVVPFPYGTLSSTRCRLRRGLPRLS